MPPRRSTTWPGGSPRRSGKGCSPMAEPKEEETRPGPENTHALFGHETAEAVLARAWRSGRLAHGWLLTGSEGIGKATLAFRFARAVLSGAMDGAAAPAQALPGLADPASPGERMANARMRNDRLPDVGPDDAAARKIAAGAHPGLRVIRRSVNPDTGKVRGEIVVGDVRRAMEFLGRTAADGGWRIVIVDPVDDMNRNAANALLKSLEEPPDKCLFLLISHVSGTVLPTIRSRCQILALSPLPAADVRAALGAAAPDLAPKADEALLNLAAGSPGRAIRLIEADAGALQDRIDAILEAPEAGGGLAALDLAEQVARSGATAAFRIVGELLARRSARLAHAAASSAARDEAAALWFEVADRFREAERLNLDRRHTVLKACRDTGRLVRAAAPPGG
ncbi:MAG: DNA polymerase III subunit delta' [Rhodospirillaceae bacterium]|nr:DNA polymerase III subunit delta' [Rhodospirillaceae bacterium]MYB12064.1 DNA polymerase III subunit delta' [Rhodospirillaceae bacterium]MYI48742.1 DNA polymerase III subunit delta' [Rhodospirillaceae bacterium]